MQLESSRSLFIGTYSYKLGRNVLSEPNAVTDDLHDKMGSSDECRRGCCMEEKSPEYRADSGKGKLSPDIIT